MPMLLLPDELLLLVSDMLDGRSRNRDLASLSLVNKRLRPIAQEKLLCSPCFDLAHIHTYLWELCHHASFLPKILCLEIRSSRDGRADDDRHSYGAEAPRILRPHYQRNQPQRYIAIRWPPALNLCHGFLENCEEVIRGSGTRIEHILAWRRDLNQDIVPALFGLLLCILPNMKEIYFANSWLMDFPVFTPVSTGRSPLVCPIKWSHPYLEHAVDSIATTLQVLEFPTDIDGLQFFSTAPFDFRRFKSLRRLSIPMGILTTFRRHEAPVDPTSILPQTLELLRISEASHPAINFVNEVCLAKKQGRFPSLNRVELYYYSTRKHIKYLARRFRCPHPVHDVRRMFLDAELGLYMYFPSVVVRTTEVGDTPWKLKEEGLLRRREDQIHEEYAKHGMMRESAFELGTDATGDLEMMDY